MELDAAIFDFGGVLTTPIFDAFTAFEGVLGVPQGALVDAFLHSDGHEHPPYQRLETGRLSEGEFYRMMRARVQERTGRTDLDWPDDPDAVRAAMFGSIRRNEEMVDAATRIAAEYRAAILSNNVKEWTGWRDMASAHLFSLVVDSSEVGLRKPDPEIYLLTCRGLDVEPHRAAFVDDLEHNVEGARAVGLNAIRFTSTDEVVARLRVHFPKAFE